MPLAPRGSDCVLMVALLGVPWGPDLDQEIIWRWLRCEAVFSLGLCVLLDGTQNICFTQALPFSPAFHDVVQAEPSCWVQRQAINSVPGPCIAGPAA